MTWYERRPQSEPQRHALSELRPAGVTVVDFSTLSRRRAGEIPADGAQSAKDATFAAMTGAHAPVEPSPVSFESVGGRQANHPEHHGEEAVQAGLAAAAEAAAAAQRRIDEAYEAGRLEGRAEAREQGDAELSELREGLRAELDAALAETAAEVAAFRARELERMREGAIELARVLAQHLLQVELRFRPDALLSVATATIGEAVGLGDLTLSVHPEALEPLTERASALRAAHPDAGAAVQLVPDESVSYGSCIVRSRLGEIHDDLEERLQRLVGLLWMRWPLPDGAAPESNFSADHPAAAAPANALGDEPGEEESA